MDLFNVQYIFIFRIAWRVGSHTSRAKQAPSSVLLGLWSWIRLWLDRQLTTCVNIGTFGAKEHTDPDACTAHGSITSSVSCGCGPASSSPNVTLTAVNATVYSDLYTRTGAWSQVPAMLMAAAVPSRRKRATAWHVPDILPPTHTHTSAGLIAWTLYFPALRKNRCTGAAASMKG